MIHQVNVASFTLNESQRYFKAYDFRYRQKEIAECHKVMDGLVRF